MINGLYCKVLNQVPRHEQIVAMILGEQYSRELNMLIGMAEIIMGFWILSSYRSRVNAILQMSIVAMMNTLEFILVPELLLWGKLNSLFAGLFIGLIYYTEFVLPVQRKPVVH